MKRISLSIKYGLLIALGLFIGGLCRAFFAYQALSNNEQRVSVANFDVLVYGDEIPGICAAIRAKQVLGDKGKVALVRSSTAHAPLGGVVTRGWLVFVDLDKLIDWPKQPFTQCFNKFLNQAGVKGGSFDIEQSAVVLKNMLQNAGVEVISDTALKPSVENQEIKFVESPKNHTLFKASAYIDATQDAELARAAGLSYFQGFESRNPNLRNATLPVSIIPRISGLTLKELMKIEENILRNYDLMSQIKQKVIMDNPPKLADLFLNSFHSPMYQAMPDSYDIRSIALGVSYHLYSQQPFNLNGFFFDRGNISIQKNGSLVWNGILFKYTATQVRQIEENDHRPTQEMIEEMQLMEAWLRQLSGKSVKVLVPEEIYVRHNINIRDVVKPLTGQEIIQGGTLPENSIGSFSYEFDVRGGIPGFVGKLPGRPVFNFGIENSLASKVNNLAIVGRAAGYTGLAPTVGRILALNAYQGEGVGVAAGLANRLSAPLNTITSQQVRNQLEGLAGKTTVLHGRDTSLTLSGLKTRG